MELLARIAGLAARPEAVLDSVGKKSWGQFFTGVEVAAAKAPEKLLVPNRTCLLLRRFSAKGEHRRLTAAILRGGTLPGRVVGLENHLNFIHRPGGALDEHEAVGLAALLNSAVVDRYFRIVNGNTQVNATEIRALPLPPRDVAVEVGRRIADNPARTPDEVIGEVLHVEGTGGEGDPQGARPAGAAAERERCVHAARDGRSEAGNAMG